MRLSFAILANEFSALEARERKIGSKSKYRVGVSGGERWDEKSLRAETRVGFDDPFCGAKQCNAQATTADFLRELLFAGMRKVNPLFNAENIVRYQSGK
jgi:hypothetical protein